MQELPEDVMWVLNRLKREYSPYLEIKRSNAGKYLLYEYKIIKDNTNYSKQIYLGIITEDGVLIPARHRKKEVIERKELVEVNARTELTEQDLGILTFLSMNGRAPVQKIAKSVGLNSNATEYRIRKLEERFGIKYMPEINMLNITFNSFVSLVRFRKKAPASEEIRKALEDIPEVQLVVSTTGDYHLAIFLYSMDNDLLGNLVFYMKTETLLKNYDAEWYTTPLSIPDISMPLRDKFFDLLGRTIWKRTKEEPKCPKGSISNKEFLLLREINKDGGASFADLDERLGWDKGHSRYLYYKMVDKDVIKRITINMTTLPKKYDIILLIDVINGNLYNETRADAYMERISVAQIAGKYSIYSLIQNPSGLLLSVPVQDIDKLEEIKREWKSKVKGIEIRELVVSNIILGSICYRRFDPRYAREYELLIELHRAEPSQKKDYL